jgi:non-ribosomal peptide synthetase-like protein
MSEILNLRAETRAGGAILVAEGADNAIRWRAGERLHHLFEGRCREIVAAGAGDRPALDVDGRVIGFAELNRWAGRIAEALMGRGVRAGDRVGLILDRSAAAYAALLGVLKAEAAFVPLDAKFPAERIRFIAEDAGIETFIVADAWAGLVEDIPASVITLGALAAAEEARGRPADAAPVPAPDLPADKLCYIIYTSGSTGRPKGVAVNHSSICNFVRVAAECYAYRQGDRVYQGITLAFDFSVEELWVPLMAGATLVPAPAEGHLVGAELARFLKARRITAMCAVPTLLATMEDDLPDLRLLLVSGEACPQDLAQRWHRPGRRMLNAYGPTEATVTATWTELSPGKPVTIGVPLATYTIAILETEANALAVPGGVGEIAIAGIGLAVGYVNREDLTQQAFVADFLHLSNNPSRRLYRTGDLGRINEDGEIEYLGRIDQQVKIRGYRIELAEIENVLLEVEGVAQTVVTAQEVQPGLKDLVAYYTCFKDRAHPTREDILGQLKSRLPGYMVPAYLEELDVIPLLASHKADRKALPRPSGLRVVSRDGDFIAPRDDLEAVIAECLAHTLGIEQVSVHDHFFDDLGAHSLLMAQCLNALNARMPEADAAIADVYLEPTVAQLAEALRARGGGAETPRVEPVQPAHVASDLQHALCGALQAVFYIGQFALLSGFMTAGYLWIWAASGSVELVGRAVAATSGLFAFSLTGPLAAKWLLVGRFEAGRVPLWGLAYYRFWVVRQMMALNPIVMFRGSALFNAYLRLLGARIGPGAIVLTRGAPVAADLIEIGAGALVRKDVYLAGYKAESGWLITGPVKIGAGATVGEGSVLDVDTEIGAGSQLGHASALHPGERVPAGKRYHGNPARETVTDFTRLEAGAVSTMRRGLHSVALVAAAIGSGAFGVIVAVAIVSALVTAPAGGGLGLEGLVATALVYSLAVFAALTGIGFTVHLVLPRLLRGLLEAGRVYPLFGVHHLVAQALARIAMSVPFQTLLGDSSFAVHYFGWLGFRQPDMRQTGSNFGCATAYESPRDVTVGSGTMISDGLSLINVELGHGTFRLMPVAIGERSFVGNVVVYPAAGRTGDNCLLATKVAVPVDGPVRERVGLLGSPAFEIPRQVASRRRFDPVPVTAAGRARLAAKNRFNLRTMAFYLIMQWVLLFAVVLAGLTGAAFYPDLGWPALAATFLALPAIVLGHALLSEWLSVAGIRITPQACTIHEPYYWWIERYWKFSETVLKYAFPGTPFRPMVLRLLGLKVGAKVFDDGSMIPEKALVEIGDHATLNAQVAIQGHSLEDGLYKADHVRIGAGATIGPAAFVHYGARMAEGSVLDADSFMMKGAESAARTRWRGNPARPVRG